MNQPIHPAEFQQLLGAACEGDLAPAEVQRLESAVLSDAELRRKYIESLNLHAALRWNQAFDLATIDAETTSEWPERLRELLTSSPIAINARKSRPSRWRALASIAAVALVFYGSFTMITWNLWPNVAWNSSVRDGVDQPSHPPEIVARLTAAEDCRWAGDQQPAVDAPLSAGQFQLDAGIAEIMFVSGTRMIIEGPSSFELRSPSRGYLAQGRLTAHVPPQAIGFIIETPSAHVVDLGTEFGVEVGDSGDTDLHVFQGAVDFITSPKASTAKSHEGLASRRLNKGESARAVLATSSFARATSHPQKFVRPTAQVPRRFGQPTLIDLSKSAVARQSSDQDLNSYPARAAIDNDPMTFTHTSGDDTAPWWQLDLGESHSIAAVVLQNRMECCGGRLRDIHIKILAADGISVAFESPLLNKENGWGAGELNFNEGPPQVVFDLAQTRGEPVVGRYVRVERTPSAASEFNDDRNVLSLAEVQVFEVSPEKSPIHSSTDSVLEKRQPR